MSESTKIISFYSFKGGTGRSTALANVAHALAERGLNVGCMDLDLAAPGLHMIFPKLGPPHDHLNQIHDYLREEVDVEHIEDFIIDIGDRIEQTPHDAPDGDLSLISGAIKPPGAGNPRQTMRRALDLRQDFINRRDLDYLLIDSRSGLSNHMIPVFDEADLFLAFHRWTHQHRRGTVALGEWLEEKPVTRDMEMLSVASNVPDTVDESETEEWVANNLYSTKVADFIDYRIINSSDILREGEKIVALEDAEAPVVQQFRSLADRIE